MTLSSQFSQRILLASALASALALSGCSLAPSTPATTQLAAMQGKVHGGQQPVGGASIQLYKASTTGYSTASTALFPTPVVSNPDGSFTLAGAAPGYTCQPGDYLYIVATGGNPGMQGTHNNSALALMAGLGPCATLTSSSFISINELTTVASVWALAPFMSSASAVGTDPTNVQGLAQAFAAINKIVDITAGTIPGPALPAGATLPIAEINTLADLLATCVNTVDTTSPAAQSSNCQTLSSETFNFGPQNTITTALNIAQNPIGSSAIYSMVSGTGAPFQPTLSGPVPAWTIAINYVGGGLSTPKAIAVDQTGNIWVMNRATAIEFATEYFDSGNFQGDLARRVAVPTESQAPSSGATAHHT